MPDAVVIGSGPNGLVGAIVLAQRGWSVVVLEAQDRPGGALYSREHTLPGFWHDVGAGFFPFAHASPALRSLRLEEVGLQWCLGEYESAHPGPDGGCAAIARDVDGSCATLGVDADAWRWFHGWQERMGHRLAEALLAPLPALGAAWRLGLQNIAPLGFLGLASPGGLARHCFRTEAAQRIFPALALHVDLGPRDFAGAGLALVLALLAAQDGFLMPVGGARAITEALLRRLTDSGGQVQLQTHVDEIVIRGKRAVAVRTHRNEEIPVRHAILADTTAPALFLRLIPEGHTPAWVRRALRRFRFGWGTFKMDWALAGPVPWRAGVARRAAVVHLGDSVADLTAYTHQVRAGELPDHPFLLIGQQSLFDTRRAPPGGHTLYGYTHVPSTLPGGWAHRREAFADRLEERIEELAPGFRGLIQGRAIFAPPDLETLDENLVGGDLGGGSNQLDQLLFFRPAFPYFNYRTHIRNVYLASASAHPGAGVHGACGWNAAQRALRDAGG
jgi:phytoene dehydrogenase-like protein